MSVLKRAFDASQLPLCVRRYSMVQYASLWREGSPTRRSHRVDAAQHLFTLLPLSVLLAAAAAADRSRRWRFIFLKAAVFLAVLWFVGSTLKEAIDDLTQEDWRLNIPSIALSAVLYVAGLVPAGTFWWWLLSRLGQHVSPLLALRAYFIGHLGKYVPGKAMVVVLRAGMVKSAGANVALATIAVLVETLTMMASGAVVALLLVALLVPPDWKLALAAALALATGGPTLPPLLNRLLLRLERKSAATDDDSATDNLHAQHSATMDNAHRPQTTAAIDWKCLAVGWAAMLGLWILLGFSLTAILRGLDPALPVAVKPCLLAIASVALATVAGFLSLLPGGLFVRELILLDLLAPQVGEATALVAAVLLRLVWLVSEIVVSGILYVVAKPH
jgi:uncharacterized membrane protein YbhN (UPF0104 family)